MTSNLLDSLKQSLDSLSKSEKKVAQIILADPEAAIHSSIATLATAADVSEPTVNRFCRSLDCKGYPDFKLKLAQCLANSNLYIVGNIEADDSTSDVVEKIFHMNQSALSSARSAFKDKEVERALQLMLAARSISFCGLGASGSVAQDALHKFFRLRTPVTSLTDSLMQRMAAAAASQDDLFVLISNTGRTITIVETAQIAKERGAKVIAITCPNSPLAKEADVVVGVDSSEDTEVFTPMSSRIVHLTVIDILATGLAVKRGPDFAESQQHIRDSLSAIRFE